MQLSSCERAYETNSMPVVARTIRNYAVAVLTNGMHNWKSYNYSDTTALTRSNECLPAQSNRFYLRKRQVLSQVADALLQPVTAMNMETLRWDEYPNNIIAWYLHSRCFLLTYKLLLKLHRCDGRIQYICIYML